MITTQKSKTISETCESNTENKVKTWVVLSNSFTVSRL